MALIHQHCGETKQRTRRKLTAQSLDRRRRRLRRQLSSIGDEAKYSTYDAKIRGAAGTHPHANDSARARVVVPREPALSPGAESRDPAF